MKLIELHIIQSFPVTCLNRDDVGAPKSAVFGGTTRARVSSQSWKRAVRMLAQEKMPDLFAGKRSRYVLPELAKALNDAGASDVEKHAAILAEALGKLDDKKPGAIKTLMFFSPEELKKAVTAYLASLEAKDKPEKAVKLAMKELQNATRDKADIALFGRMVADDPTLTLEGAGMFSHALSTHKVSNDIDFFTAVDDLNPAEDAGSGHMGTTEFNTACYYRYIAINVDLLKKHLDVLTDDELKRVIDVFLQACLEAVPTARKNSMMGYTLPEHVLGLARSGQPLSLANAFETAIKSSNGIEKPSAEQMLEHWGRMKTQYDLKADAEVAMPEKTFAEFRAELLSHV